MKIGIYNHQYLRGACPGCYKYYLEGMKSDAAKSVKKALEIYGNDIEIVNFTDIGPYPNSSIDRPGYRRMLDAVRNREIDVLVVYKLGSISSNIDHIIETYKILKENDVPIITALDGKAAEEFLEKALVEWTNRK